jgi:L-alanine-DL-glutamate epimerase-like enolase superfamily enzyme
MDGSRRQLLQRALATVAGAPLFNLLSPEGSLAQAREQARPLNLKITGLKTFLTAPTVSPGGGIFVKVYTNQGLVGLGLATQTSKEVSTAAAIEEFTPFLVGRDPTQIEAIWEDLYQAPRWRGGPLTAALSAVDIALWDILGQALGVPIYKLLGGPIHDKIRVYGGGGGTTPESWASTKAVGYTASRVAWPSGSVTTMIEYTKAMRKAAGPDHEIAIHGQGRLPTSEALQYMRGVEECNLMWVEEPIQMDDVEDWAHLRAHTSTPIATGERLTTKYAFNPYLFRHLIDFAQPDLCACGGILEGRKIAAIAEANRIRMAPHGPHGPAGALANFHLDAATPNFYIQETREYAGQFEMDLHEGMIPIIKNGYCELPTRPGLGTVLNEKVAATKPFKGLSRGSGIGLGAGISAWEEGAAKTKPSPKPTIK